MLAILLFAFDVWDSFRDKKKDINKEIIDFLCSKLVIPPVILAHISESLTNFDSYALVLLCKLKKHDYFKHVLSLPDCNAAAGNNECLLFCAEMGGAAMLDLLLNFKSDIPEYIPDPTCNDNEPIRLSISHKQNLVLSRLLQDPRVDPSANANIAIKCASAISNFPAAKMLLYHPKIQYKDVAFISIVEIIAKGERFQATKSMCLLRKLKPTLSNDVIVHIMSFIFKTIPHATRLAIKEQ